MKILENKRGPLDSSIQVSDPGKTSGYLYYLMDLLFEILLMTSVNVTVLALVDYMHICSIQLDGSVKYLKGSAPMDRKTDNGIWFA